MIKEKHTIDSERIQVIAEILKTIGHPVRLGILQVLKEKEPLSVSDILENIESNVEQSLLSHHLIKMKDKGLLTAERKGMHKMYRIADRQILKIFNCMEKCNF